MLNECPIDTINRHYGPKKTIGERWGGWGKGEGAGEERGGREWFVPQIDHCLMHVGNMDVTGGSDVERQEAEWTSRRAGAKGMADVGETHEQGTKGKYQVVGKDKSCSWSGPHSPAQHQRCRRRP